jgi:hypothetical protein
VQRLDVGFFEAQSGVIFKLEKKDSLPMSTNNPMPPATGAPLVSVSDSTSMSSTVALRRVSSMSISR